MTSRRVWFAAGFLFIAAGMAAAADETESEAPEITTQKLLGEMIDLSALAEFPDPPFTCRQFSSYDRKSRSPSEEWFANNDRGQYLRVEQDAGRDEYVMMDAAGPGAIVRIWSANPAGTLRIYIDGAAEPVIEAPMTDFLSGACPEYPEPICHTASKGWNSYFPIPYAEHCKVTSDAGDFYYQINYRTYPAGTRVASFTDRDLVRAANLLEVVCSILAAPADVHLAYIADFAKKEIKISNPAAKRVAPGEHFTESITLPGGGAVVGIEVRIEAADLDAALRGTLLEMAFDGETTVQAPVGDFFGAAPGIVPYASLPMGMDADGKLWCRWWMPFREACSLSLANHTGDEIGASVRTLYLERPWTERSMYFHAKWRIDKQIPTRPMIDWNYIQVDGRGVFAGDALNVANPSKIWWGEGDEKIYVDGETFPSHFGTGTEDYYGYAWCCPEPFVHAYHNQPRCDGPGNYGHTAVNRWHILDCIPFNESFRFDMEVWHWRDVKIDYAVTSYWYAFEGQNDNFAGPAADPQDLVLDRLPPYQAARAAGAQEGEELEVVSATGVAEPQDAGEGYSGEAHLWWRDAAEGDTLTLAFTSEKAGPHHVFAVLTKANDYGIHQLAVNGREAGEPIDLFKTGQWSPTGEIDLGVFDLEAGRNLLTVTIKGRNPEAVPNFMFGLDYLRIAE